MCFFKDFFVALGIALHIMLLMHLKPGAHWGQSRLLPKPATKSTVADTVEVVAGFGDKSATTWIRQLVAVDIVANSVDSVTSMVDFVAAMVDFVASLYFQQSRPCFRSCGWILFTFTIH